MDFYERFHALLGARGFKNIRDLARQADVPASSLYDLRTGKIPRDDRLLKLSKLLRIDEGLWRYGSDEAFLAALTDPDHTAPEPEPPTELPDRPRGWTGEVRPYRLSSAVGLDGVVTGPASLIGLTGDLAEVARVLPLEAGRRGLRDNHRVVGLVGVPRDVVLVDLPEGLVVRDSRGQDLARWPKGYVITLAEGRHMRGDELDLVLAVHDDGGSEVLNSLMRWRQGAEGEDLLYPIDGSRKGVSTEQGWRITATVVGEPRRPETWTEPLPTEAETSPQEPAHGRPAR